MVLTLSEQSKYLGILIDNSLMWRFQIEIIKGTLSRASGLLKDCKNFLPMGTLKDI